MKSFSAYSKAQYALVTNSRKVLFDYCSAISTDDFVNQNTSFGRGGSMRNLLVHIANTYQYWIANIALKKNIAYDQYETIKNIAETIKLFHAVDDFMVDFLESRDLASEIHYQIDGINHITTHLKVFTHVTTHEFHHKGQILSISRHLGYIPIDTDIIR